MSRKEIIDTWLTKLLSRKLMVFLISAVALFTGNIDGESWIVVSTAYIGGETIIDAVTRLKGISDR